MSLLVIENIFYDISNVSYHAESEKQVTVKL